MKLMFFPVTMIEDFPHTLLYYNFSRRKDRYFLSPYEVEITAHGSQKTVCDIVRSSDFLCGLLDIDRPTILKQMATSNVAACGSSTTEESPSPLDDGQTGRRALSCSSTNQTTDLLSTMIEQRLDFKHRCMFYSTGPASDLCGRCIELWRVTSPRSLALVCALEVDHNSSVVCNAIGYPNLVTDDLSKSDALKNDDAANSQTPASTKPTPKMRHQHRQSIHQWICIQDITNGLITCNHVLKSNSINEILTKMDLWIKQRNETKSTSSKTTIDNVKSFKAQARQLVWDLMEMK